MDDLDLPVLTRKDIIFRNLGQKDYLEMQEAMKVFNQTRTPETLDEVWFCEHPPVFTYGKFADLSHILNPENIPVVPTDRGGQVTYHGPGQLMIYTLVNLKKRKIGIKAWVNLIESWIIELLANFEIQAERISHKPGIYIQDQKICSIGLRVTQGCCSHGAAFNFDMDLSPFRQINPCGYPDQVITDLSKILKLEKLEKPALREMIIELVRIISGSL